MSGMELSKQYNDPEAAMIFRVYDGSGGPGLVTFEVLRKLTAADIAAVQKTLAALGVPVERITALEAKQARFYTAKATLGVLAVGGKAFTLTVPGVLKGDFVYMQPQVDLPAGLAIAWARAVDKDTVKFAVTVPILISLTTETTFDLMVRSK